MLRFAFVSMMMVLVITKRLLIEPQTAGFYQCTLRELPLTPMLRLSAPFIASSGFE